MYEHMDDYLKWLAGFVDGEGCFSIQINLREQRGRHSLTCTPKCSVAQHYARRAVLETIKERMGYGSVYAYPKRPGAQYSTTNREDSFKFASTILPYLTVKDAAAKELLRACALLENCPREGVNMYGGERVLDINIATEVVEIAASMNESLNHGDRMNGKSRDEMMDMIRVAYDQTALPSNRIEVACVHCGTLHERYFSSIKPGQNMFCSKPCADAYSAVVSPTKYKVDVTCHRCQTVFKRIKSDVKPHRNFCGVSCSNKFAAAERKAKLNVGV